MHRAYSEERWHASGGRLKGWGKSGDLRRRRYLAKEVLDGTDENPAEGKRWRRNGASALALTSTPEAAGTCKRQRFTRGGSMLSSRRRGRGGSRCASIRGKTTQLGVGLTL